ncbi:MAG: homocysteine S-methyltransferase family protein, partial [Bacteroidota bacterium]|nr:homocysteine S-methyltransferase family protein [Bacteroidota bacterium]
MADKLLKFVTPFVPKRKPLLLDGAIGTYLLNNNAAYDKDLWTSHIAVEAPHLLESVHSEYIKAGADIIISNTFRTNPQAVKNSKYSSEFLVKRNMDIIRDCSKDKDLLIAGSNAPAEDCYQLERTISRSDLEYNHHKQICLLMENGADFILNETQSHLDE